MPARPSSTSAARATARTPARTWLARACTASYGRKAGSVEGFNYSDAMKDSGKTWDDAALDAYIADPKGAVPGNKMVFVGIKDETDRKNLIAFLKTVK